MSGTTIKRRSDADAGLERIKTLERRLAKSPANSRLRRELTQAIHIEATVYRKSLDADQARRNT